MNIDTILFDLDGTLIDTNELIHQSFVYTFEQYGYSFTREEILQFNGPPLVDTFTALNPDLAEEMIATYRKHNLAHHNDYVSLFPNVKETLEELHKHGVKMGIVSAKMRDGVKLGLEVTNIKQYFDTIIAVDDVKNPKPHPEPVLKGMSNLASSPSNTIMVGDNYHDIESGKNAGTKTVAVSWSLKGEKFLKQYNPTYIIEDMHDLLPIIGV